MKTQWSVPYRQIRSLDGLMLAARRRRAVIVGGRSIRRIPAAFVIGMPARTVYDYIRLGMYLYKKEK